MNRSRRRKSNGRRAVLFVTARRPPTGSSKLCALRAMYFSARIDPMRFSTTGRTSFPSVASFVPLTLSRAVTLGIVLPATLAASTAFAQVPPPAVNARSWVLVDATSNQVLASGNADERVEPASLTKLMTAYLVFEALQTKKITMDQTVMPSEAVRRVRTDESRMFIEANKPVTVHDLVYGMIVQSGNDAAIALAELVGGSEAQFVNMMNTEAQRLGMKNTHFADVNGMPDRAALHDGGRPRGAVGASDSRLPRLLQHLLGQGIHVQQDQAAEPQPSAVDRPDRRRPEDRPHASGRLLPDRERQAFAAGHDRRIAPPRLGDDGRDEGTRPRAGQPEDAELRLHRVRHGASVQGESGGAARRASTRVRRTACRSA